MGLSMADAIGALARVDLAARGLSDLGKPDGWGERQVPRWREQLDSYSELPGYPGPEIPGLDDVAAWLDEHRPADIQTASSTATSTSPTCSSTATEGRVRRSSTGS